MKPTRRPAASLTLVLLSISIGTAGCSSLFGRDGYFRDRGDDYLEAKEIPPLKIPAHLDSSALSELFVIPPVSNEFVDKNREFEVPRPDYVAVEENALVKIQKLDNRRWILVNSSPATIWPRIKSFLAENDYPVSMEDTANGRLESGWLTLKDSADSKDRYRFSVEQGLHTATTEIHVLQITVPAATPGAGSVNWPLRSSSPDREKWMVDKLAGYLAQPSEESVSLAAQSIGRTQKVTFIQPYQQETFLLIALDQDRVMASVGGALARMPFHVEDIQRSSGYIYTSYDPDYIENDPEQESPPGFFSKLFGLDKKAERERQEKLLHYRVQIEALDNRECRVYIRDMNGNALPEEERDRLLQKIRQGLI